MNPPKSYPGKLTKFLYERYKHFDGAADKGLVMLPVELIDDNGIHLKECVLKLAKLWNLEEGFTVDVYKRQVSVCSKKSLSINVFIFFSSIVVLGIFENLKIM